MGEKWLIYDFRSELPSLGAYNVRGGVGQKEGSSDYSAFAINNFGKLLAHEGRWEGKVLVFTLIFPERQDATRVTYAKIPGGRVRTP